MSDITVTKWEPTRRPREIRIVTSRKVKVLHVGEEHDEETDVFWIRGKGGPFPKKEETEVCTTSGGRALNKESAVRIWEAVLGIPQAEKNKILGIVHGMM